MKILYVSQYFPPVMGAPSGRVYELSREWVRMGHDVSVLTGFPNHPVGIVFKGYRGEIMRRERVDGIRVVRIPIYAAANKAFLKRVLNYSSFWLSASTFGAALTETPDVVVGTSPQFLTAVAGLWLARVKRAPFVFEVRDLWPRSIVEEGAMKQGLKERASAEKIENVAFWDQQPRDRLAQIYAASDLCLVVLRDLPLFRTVIPSKIFEFMGAARPILTTVDGESRGIIEQAH